MKTNKSLGERYQKLAKAMLADAINKGKALPKKCKRNEAVGQYYKDKLKKYFNSKLHSKMNVVYTGSFSPLDITINGVVFKINRFDNIILNALPEHIEKIESLVNLKSQNCKEQEFAQDLLGYRHINRFKRYACAKYGGPKKTDAISDKELEITFKEYIEIEVNKGQCKI